MAENEPRRSLRLALIEVRMNETPTKSTSPDEMVIVQRGPRCKPITWSPVDYETSRRRDTTTTPEPAVDKMPPRKPDLNPKIRRRLVMSPGKTSQDLGEVIAKKLKVLPKFNVSATT